MVHEGILTETLGGNMSSTQQSEELHSKQPTFSLHLTGVSGKANSIKLYC